MSRSRPTQTPPPRTDDAASAWPRPRGLHAATLFALIFASIFVLHLPLLGLPYYWDEAGYFIPAARDILHAGDFIPHSTLSNAHPPLLMAYLALGWKLFGEGIVVTRAAMLVVAALALLGVFCLARRVANKEVAVAATACTALYPVFFAQSALAHLDMAAAALTIWGLLLYLPPDGNEAGVLNSPGRRRTACVFLFALAALAKETAILTPLTLMGWELLCRWSGRGREAVPAFCAGPRRNVGWSFLLLLPLLPLALWLAYHRHRTGYLFGNPEYFRYNVGATMSPSRILFAGSIRLWHVTAYMNLFFLTVPALLLMALRRPAVRDNGEERRRIDVPTQLVFAVVIVAHVAALSLVGGAVLARYMLPVVPLVILLCVSTVRRRARHWRKMIVAACLGFALGIVVNPPHSYPWEENLAYRDFIILHKDAGHFISNNYADARVLTMWPASDELKNPYYGYVSRRIDVVPVENFRREHLEAAARRKSEFDLALLFSTHGGPTLEEAVSLLGGRIVFREERNGQWVAVVEMKQ